MRAALPPFPRGTRLLSVLLLSSVLAAAVQPSRSPLSPDVSETGIVLDPRLVWMDTLPVGPFIKLEDGSLLTVDGTDVLASRDDGRTWQRSPLFTDPDKYVIRMERALIRTRRNTLILAFANDREKSPHFWDNARREPRPDIRLPTYVTRSLDGGRTWQTPLKLHDDWTGAIRDIVETDDGSIVFTTMKVLREPGRHACLTYRSIDEGATWQPSNLIDLGGHGHHDGAMEPTLVQLRDGRLWMLIRTTHDFFYEAWSADDGRTWREVGPTTIDASTAPGMLQRLASGRLVLVWNRLYPEGRTDYPRRADKQATAVPTTRQRDELSITFSDDDGKHWSRPTVILRSKKKDTSYPYVFEHRPGELWITTMRGTVLVKLHEDDFIR
ncbi:MAG: exo-alpha-sialidase [Opitutaceae bacterium]|nr:exo-alpha-sialidase [Opitutaceae bacterium]